ncbi:hypothetical protein Leryth_011047 [Lithospermum erythrorhizon]|nr:hypothetical protein Leryth_011047 [Lithospermum erythrorhizon]
MGLESQLTNVSSESIPILIFTTISNSICYLRSRFFAILQHNHEIEDPQNVVVGSGLANVVMLAEQLNLNLVVSYKYKEKNGDNCDEMKCVVCLNYFSGGEQVRTLACMHVFHKSCFDGWLDQLNFNCPLCRSELIADEHVE